MPPLGRKAYNIPPASKQMGVNRGSAHPLPQPLRTSLQKAEPPWLREELPGARGNHALAVFSSSQAGVGRGGRFTILGRFPYFLLETHLSSEKGGFARRRGQIYCPVVSKVSHRLRCTKTHYLGWKVHGDPPPKEKEPLMKDLLLVIWAAFCSKIKSFFFFGQNSLRQGRATRPTLKRGKLRLNVAVGLV